MKKLLILAIVGLAIAVPTAQRQTTSGYLTPPKVIVDIMDAEPLPGVALSPDRKTMLMTHRRSMPTLAEVASPMLRLGGSRISPRTNGTHVLNGTTGLTLKDVATGSFGASFSPPRR